MPTQTQWTITPLQRTTDRAGYIGSTVRLITVLVQCTHNVRSVQFSSSAVSEYPFTGKLKV